MKVNHFVGIAAFCLVCLASFTSYAAEVEAQPAVPATEEIAFAEEELGETCSITVYCQLSCGPLVRCSGSTCSHGYDWVECDGVRSYCHYRDIECEIDCDDEYMLCIEQCHEFPEGDCGCEDDYDDCVWACCFG
jgi:hypothetical protein